MNYKLIVWCLGGLGNQMFQYAFYRAFELRGAEVYLDISNFESYSLHNGYELDRVFGIEARIAKKEAILKIKGGLINKILDKLYIRKKVTIQDGIGFNAKYLTRCYKNDYLLGYWQSENFFAEFKTQIRNDFIFPRIDNKNSNILEQIKRYNSISIHVRMGDYVDHPIHGGICTVEYYLKAIKLICSLVYNPQFFIFSNDIEWCKNNLNLENAFYVSGNDSEESFRDMQLMSLCQHNIIANSSFSWWGAWLNNNQNKIVIAPQKWFNDPKINTKDLIPDGWYKI